MATFISLIETGRLRRERTIPRMERKLRSSGLRTTWPDGSTIKSTRLPVFRCSRSRTSRGIVICPLLVRVLVGITVPIFLTYGKDSIASDCRGPDVGRALRFSGHLILRGRGKLRFKAIAWGGLPRAVGCGDG